jgi:hypothetical protein
MGTIGSGEDISRNDVKRDALSVSAKPFFVNHGGKRYSKIGDKLVI